MTHRNDTSATNPIRVCHVIHSLGAGGAEQALLELARVAPAAGLALSVLSLTRTTDEPRYAASLRAAGAEVVDLGLSSRWDARALLRATTEVRRLRPDVLHTHLKHADLVGSYASRRLRIPMVSTLHLIEKAPSGQGRLKRGLAAAARRRSAALTIAVSEALRSWYLETFGVPSDRVVTVHNGISPPPVLPAAERARVRRELGVSPDQVLVTMVGIMRPGKGHADLIEAVRRIPPAARLHLLIVGDGPLRQQLGTAARDVATAVTFTGFRTDVSTLLAASDLVAHPPHEDALPTALIEAIAAGLPVVATDVGGIPEIVTPDAGRLVRAGDVAALAAHIAEFAEDGDARRTFGAGARAHFEREFGARRWARRLRHRYEEVLTDTGAPHHFGGDRAAC